MLPENVERGLTFIVGCVGLAVSGHYQSFGAYSNAIKAQFNYTQTQVEVLEAFLNFGISLDLPVGILYEVFGVKWVSFGGFFLGAVGFTLLYTTTQMQPFYYTHSWLQYVYFFMTGLSGSFMCLSCLIPNMINFHPKHRGKIVGILCAFISLGPVIFVGMYGSIFARGHLKDEEKQDLCGFYLMSAVTFGVAGSLGILFLKQLPIEMDMNSDATNLLDSGASPTQNILKQQNDVTGQNLICKLDFHYVFWAFIMSTSLLFTFQNNTGTYLKSFGLENYITLSATLIPIAGVFSKFFAGFLSDLIFHKVPRSGILFIVNIVQTLCLIMSIFLIENPIFFIIAIIIFGSANGAFFCITPTMVSEFYGMKYFGRNYGFVLLGQAFCHFVMQQIFGTLYDINTDSRNNCFGLHCFMWSFVIFAVLSSCATVCHFCLLKKELNERKNIGDKNQVEINVLKDAQSYGTMRE